jgi:hypothetical protein
MTIENAKEVLSSEYNKNNLKYLYEDLLFSDYTEFIAMYSILQIHLRMCCKLENLNCVILNSLRFC